jgi:type II secretory pathway pseudopilin PulG
MRNKESGETLIEAMLAMAVILLALIGLLSLSSFNYLSSRETFNRNIALDLAREGIELARNVRDSNWFRGCSDLSKPANCFAWNTGLCENINTKFIPVFDTNTNKWILQKTAKDLKTCVEDKTCLMNKTSLGVYSPQVTGEATRFYRLLEINPICKNEAECGGDGVCQNGEKCVGEQIGMQLLSFVRWQETNTMRNAKLEERLYNWR